MNNDNYNNRLENLKKNIAIYNFTEELKQKNIVNTLTSKEKRRLYFMKKKIIATTCASVVLVSGIAIATNFENIKNHFNRGLGDGVDTAIDNGYIAKPQMEFVKLDNVDAKVKIEDFVMDDVNLSTNFSIEFGENIKNSITMEKINEISLSDLIVRDEENRIIYSNANKEKFDKYCKENNLEYTFGEFNENYMNSGISSFITSKDNNSMNFMYNMYTSSRFPKSKKLYFSFETILLKEISSEKEKSYELNGHWDATVDVPKEMYNRSEIYYKVIDCNNENFDVYVAKATNTGFELGIIISNIEEPEWDNEKTDRHSQLVQKESEGSIKENELEELQELKEWFTNMIILYEPIYLANHNLKGEMQKISYIENEKEQKFECSFNVSRRTVGEFLENNKFNFYETFDMTKYDATDKIKVILYYYEQPVTIELEKA